MGAPSTQNAGLQQLRPLVQQPAASQTGSLVGAGAKPQVLTASTQPPVNSLDSGSNSGIVQQLFSGIEQVIERVVERVMEKALEKLTAYIDSLFGIQTGAQTAAAGEGTGVVLGADGVPLSTPTPTDSAVNGGVSSPAGLPGTATTAPGSGSAFSGFCSAAPSIQLTLTQSNTQSQTSEAEGGGILDLLDPIMSGLKTVLGSGKDGLTKLLSTGSSLLSGPVGWATKLLGF